jgi:hypothetical protein
MTEEKKEKSNITFKSIIDGSFLAKSNFVELMPFLFFLSFLALCYIANGYYAEDKVRAINNLANELKEMRSEYITTKSDLMFRSKQSEVAKALELYGIKESVVPPKKIVIKN